MSFAYASGNRLTLLRSGREYFPALEDAIREANREIFLEAYIYTEDETARRITDALLGAARRGVSVHVLVDGFGSRDLMSPDLGERLLFGGVKFLVYRPEVRAFRFSRQRLRRMHRKMAVMDARVGFVGGINIIDDMNTPGQMPPRYDFAVRVEGPLVADIQEQVERLWSLVAWVNLHRRWRASHHQAHEAAQRGAQRAALLVRDNLRHRSNIEDAYLEAMRDAR